LGSGVLILALATTLVSLCGQLPAQNVLLATVIIGFIGGAIHSSGIDWDSVRAGHLYWRSGPKLFNALSWFVPLLWVIVILNSRGSLGWFCGPGASSAFTAIADRHHDVADLAV